jgi:hypothetical protein
MSALDNVGHRTVSVPLTKKMYKLKILQNMGHVAKIKLHIPNMNKGEEA